MGNSSSSATKGRKGGSSKMNNVKLTSPFPTSSNSAAKKKPKVNKKVLEQKLVNAGKTKMLSLSEVCPWKAWLLLAGSEMQSLVTHTNLCVRERLGFCWRGLKRRVSQLTPIYPTVVVVVSHIFTTAQSEMYSQWNFHERLLETAEVTWFEQKQPRQPEWCRS